MEKIVRILFPLITAVGLSKASEPPRDCIDTGPVCIETCTSNPNGNYQWCGSCQWFIQCSSGNTYYQPCPANLYYSHNVGGCAATSTTCTECIVDTTTNQATGTTTQLTPPVGDLCQSTGPDCIHGCDQTTNGIYQWCARCDYFLDCSGSSTYYMQCVPGTFYDHSVKACVYNSTTCFQSPCYEYLTTTTPVFDYCKNMTCLFGATCINYSDGRVCICTPGYTGDSCETVTDYCQSDPCLNGGTCLVEVNGFTCLCPPGYTGDRCQTIIDTCASQPCLNGGTCRGGVNQWTCECLAQWTGTRCESLINNCDSQPCVNGGTCVNNCDVYQCVCPPGFTGVNCETVINSCDSQPCVNGGTCVNNCDTYQCVCPPGFTGINCEIVIDNCASCPCLNGGTCQNYINNWVCVCTPSFTGTQCETIVDDCESNPCLHGGTCIPNCGMYQCICPANYTGDRCQTSIGTCNPNPCVNGGTCRDDGNGLWHCGCPPQWTGRICESPNYIVNDTCGDFLTWTGYPASHNFTRLCKFYADLNDLDGRNVPCWNTIHGIPLYDDYTQLLNAGGNFGCMVSQDYPNDLPLLSDYSCTDGYSQHVRIGDCVQCSYMAVCLRYPYAGIPRRKDEL